MCGKELRSVRRTDTVVHLELKTRKENVCQNKEETESRLVSFEDCF